MRRYFVNPELKRSSVVLLFLNIIFMLGTILTLKLYQNSLKQDYIKTFGYITVIISQNNPEIIREIAPIITKGINNRDAEEGERILKQYGLTKELENNLFPYINKSNQKYNWYIADIFMVMVFVFFILNYIQCGYFYKRIRRINLGAKKIIDGDYNISINENKEGDFSKLSTSFNSMREIIKNSINELKSEKQFLVDLLSDISHQLKTPLSSMIIYNDILLDKKISKEQSTTFLINSKNQLYRMNWLIKSILKLARLDAKSIEFNMEYQSLNETVNCSIEALDEKIANKRIEVNFNQFNEVIFLHDRDWICEALINIVKNCVEHTQRRGKIDIDIMENPIYKRITISDNGEGIDDKDLPNIFKRFYKAKTSRNSESIGIGLALSKSIIESHNGIIDAQSEIGNGTKFIITFLNYY
ncbi:HAMP domain-containing sensor histidine kinase [Clostridium tyrobutyricum]|uniref:HAMP domain-containing sensor histidine kinase n=1 Tax=Clostridium tyrobutyricum TaxID=1519 RepID=UPI001C386EAB|nr:HAMP domain-containing sensor histidine kinase [Clostridium tyrobutyricum]MBV4427389.1 HAMP domain-containing histidine kinase [Clostridium tyrobutyricum]MBV4443461.1 HAMP domain-containing histidine kinase [Clostridium tyrobutyricum]